MSTVTDVLGVRKSAGDHGKNVLRVWSVMCCTEVIAADVREDVEGDERHSGGVCRDDRRGRRACEVIARQVRVPAGVNHERILQPAQAVQHDESRRAARLQGLRHRYAHRLQNQVNPPFHGLFVPWTIRTVAA